MNKTDLQLYTGAGRYETCRVDSRARSLIDSQTDVFPGEMRTMIRHGLAYCLCALLCLSQSALAGPATDRSAWAPTSIRLAKGSKLPLRAKAAATERRRAAQAPDAIPPLPVRKSATGAALPPEPDVWSDQEIKQALDRCTALLGKVDAVVEQLAPMKDGKCGTAAPVRLRSLGKTQKVTFSAPALINCRMVAALDRWIKNDLQPLARKHLGARIAKVSVMSDYSCRRSSGRRNRWSEHAYVDALDIRGFETVTGEKVYVLDGWGMTNRDIVAQAAAAKAEAAKAAGAAKAREQDAARKNGGTKQERTPAGKSMELAAARLGGPQKRKDGNTKVAALAAFPAFLPAKGPTDTRKSHFLRAAHAAACRIFKTTLGPEANNAHRNHFHVDMAKRKYTKNICD
jgi:hypothetical protein